MLVQFYYYFPDCARDVKYYEAVGYEMQLTCDSYGNYDTIQQTNRQTYCVDRDGYAVSDYLNASVSQINCNAYLYYEQN